jgi:hypothetical protein
VKEALQAIAQHEPSGPPFLSMELRDVTCWQ